jgi:type I restriction enzyme S subunit
MTLKFEKIGKYLRLSNETNTNLDLSRVRGVSITKQLIKTKANMKDVDISDYKVVHKGQFVFNPNTARMGEKIPIAMNTGDDVLVSKIYPVFEVIDRSVLLPEYLFLWFKRPDFDRYARFHSWGSARETFDWEEMCKVEIPLPALTVQEDIVKFYVNLSQNQNNCEKGIKLLEDTCLAFMAEESRGTNYKPLGSYIEEIVSVDHNLDVSRVRGVSITKKLIKTKANMQDVDISDYKTLRRREFVFISVTSRNGEKISVALNDENDVLVSKTYIVFKIKKLDELLPEYLLLWFKRPEFDRYARFHSWGSARETFNWENMCSVSLPIPSLARQEAIVNIFRALEKRKEMNQIILDMLNIFPPTIMQGVRNELVKSVR